MIVYQTNNFKNTPFADLNLNHTDVQSNLTKVCKIVKKQMLKGK